MGVKSQAWICVVWAKKYNAADAQNENITKVIEKKII